MLPLQERKVGIVPCYFFSVFDGTAYPDPDGTELSNLEAARKEAIRASAEMLREWTSDEDDWRMNVTDEAGHVALTVKFSVERC